MTDDNSIKGVVQRIVFQSEDTGWAVVRFEADGKPVTAVGHLLGVRAGEPLKLTGKWITDPKFGRQFQVQNYLPDQPASVLGITKYLGSGLVDGIGPVMAERLVNKFGLETLEVIENQPHRLSEVEGIGKKRKDMIASAWTDTKQVRDVMVFLQGHNISTSHAAKIYRDYGNQAVATVRANPYQLATDIRGIGFKTADKIANSLGFAHDSPHRIAAGIMHLLRDMSQEGHVFAPLTELIQRVDGLLGVSSDLIEKALLGLEKAEVVVREANDIFLKELHEAEAQTAVDLRRVLERPLLRDRVDVDAALEWVQVDALIDLGQQQANAIRTAITAKLLVITGGPGTGKTTIVNSIIRVLKREGRSISLCAPTGRASKRLQEATGQEAKTIHRLLEYNPKENNFKRDAEQPLECDVLIVDEFSMVDVSLCRHLLAGVSDDTQLIFVGDIDQLPSVGPGEVLKEIISAFPEHVVRLDQIYRQDESSLIVSNAHNINRGQLPATATSPEGDFFFIDKPDPEEALNTIIELVTKRIPARFGMNPTTDIQVLTPMHRGILGASNLNETLQTRLNPSTEGVKRGDRLMRVGDKVMQLRNNYDLNVFNGDLGQVTQIDPEDKTVTVRFDQERVDYGFDELDELSLAYACTIHKSQGSEFPAVVIPLHGQHYVMLQRKLIYTAVTRGKKLVCIVGTKQALRMAVENRGVKPRNTHLAKRLRSTA